MSQFITSHRTTQHIPHDRESVWKNSLFGNAGLFGRPSHRMSNINDDRNQDSSHARHESTGKDRLQAYRKVKKGATSSLTKFREHMLNWCESTWFNTFMMTIIAINSLMIALITFKAIDGIHPAMQNPCVRDGFIEFMEWMFFFVYLWEFLVKVIGMGWVAYMKGFNVFDFLLLVISIVERLGAKLLKFSNEGTMGQHFGFYITWDSTQEYSGFPGVTTDYNACQLDTEMQWLGTSKWIVNEYGPMAAYVDRSSCTDSSCGGGTKGGDVGTGTASSMKMFRFMRVFRALRALRAIRTIRFIRSLNVLLEAIISTVANYVLSVALVVACLVVILGVIGHNMFSSDKTIAANYLGVSEATEDWTTLKNCVLSLIIIFTVDGWYDLNTRWYERRAEVDPNCSIGDGGRNCSGSVMPNVYLLLSLVVLHFVLFNIFVGINIINIQEANSEYYNEILAEKTSSLAKKKNDIMERQFEDVRKLKDRQRVYQGTGGTGGFYDMISSFRETLRHDDYVVGDNPVSDLDWIELELDTLDAMDDQMYRVQQAFFEMAHILSMKANEALKNKLHGSHGKNDQKRDSL